MKRLIAVLLGGFFFVGCSHSTDTVDNVTHVVRSSLPAEWTLTTSVDPSQFKPLRGLTDPVAQLILTNESKTLTSVLGTGGSKVFHPSLILLVFPIADLKKVEDAVRTEAMRSDYPPVIFGLTDKYILVTSPGYVNEGLHTPEADATILELKDSLMKTMRIRYEIEPGVPGDA